MSVAAPTIRSDLTRVVFYAVLSVFLIPLLTWLFVHHAEPHFDAQVLASIEASLARQSQMPEAEREQLRAFYRAVPASKACDTPDPRLQAYREGVCARYSTLWQFHTTERVATLSLGIGLAVLLVIAALSALAFWNRSAQRLSLLLGWRLITAASAAGVVVQGALVVWLSFWLTAYFFEVYFLKLIAVVGIGAAVAAFYAVVCLFKQPPIDMGVDGEVLDTAEAPALWSHVLQVAQRLQTRAPDHIVAGIDANFFVTEAPLRVGKRALSGRCLFVSLPLLRILDRAEADAVLAHELAHLRGGDAASSAALGPMLARYDHYSQMMASSGLTRFAFHLLHLYRVIYTLALRRDSRAREFLADRMAAKLVSPPAIARALVKIAAYAQYRSETEGNLFEHNQQHGESLGMAARISEGLAPYAQSARFAQDIALVSVPHPFDSHPPLPERMTKVGHVIKAEDFGRVVSNLPQESWVSDILTAAAIEQRLWSAYEQHFASLHEQALAYRYEPANETERAIVLKHFPPQVFELDKQLRIEIHHDRVLLPPPHDVLAWDGVAGLRYEDGFGADYLHITHPEKGWPGARTTKVKLPGIKKHREPFKATLGRYWQRHQAMRQHQAQSRAEQNG